MIRLICLALFLSGAMQCFTQSLIPVFLSGTWKINNEESYEHWDVLNSNTLKGFSYKLKNGNMKITEYLEISQNKKNVTYTATVLNQNKGKGIGFKLTSSDNSYTFENPTHDFPKKIVYQKLSDSKILVRVSDGKQKGFEFTMEKQDINIQKDTSTMNQNYDGQLAAKLGSDDYGMKSYVFAILKTGSDTSTDKTFVSNCFRGHMDNINKLVKEKKLIVAGPLGKNDDAYRGIFILNVSSFEEAHELLKNDTAIHEGIFDYNLYKWHGSAALPEYLKYADKIWKIKP